jgi:scyllo-inositol 2-dehydrogenase (NAD+)
MSQLGVGVAGVGVMGERHAENLAKLVPGARLAAVTDFDRERAKKVAADLGAVAVATIEEMAARPDVNAVVIVSPGGLHAAHVQAVAAAGKDIFCEKPLATRIEDCDAALAVVKRAKVRLQMGHMRRYDPAYADAMQRIEAGEIGEPVIFRSIGRDQFLPPPAYFQQGNAMLFLDSSIHDFDLARWLMRDEVSEVHAFGSGRMPEVAPYGDLEAGVVNLRFQHGAIGNVESFRQCCYGYDIRTEVVGSKGTLMIGSLQHRATTVLKRDGVSSQAITHWLERFSDAYLVEVRDFVETMLAGREPRVTGYDGRQAVAISLAAARSVRENRGVALAEMHAATASKAS